MKLIFATIAMAAVVVEAANHQVMVGLTGLTFSPNSVTAAVGDTIEFIVSGTHDITEAAFGSPCSYMTGGAWSGVSPTPNFVITVAATTPRFFYCSIASHCQSGMVFALNPSSTETESAFSSAAASAGNSVTPSGPPTGGTSGPVPSGSVSSAAASSSASTEASSATSSAASAVSSAASGTSSAVAAGSSAASGTTRPSSGSTAVVASSDARKEMRMVDGLRVVCGGLLALIVMWG